MTSAIELFNSLQLFYKTLGLDIHDSSHLCQQTNLPNARSLFLLISSLQLFLSPLAFFLFKARTAEFTSFYISITIICVVVNITTVAYETSKLIGKYEEIIEKQNRSIEFYSIYNR